MMFWGEEGGGEGREVIWWRIRVSGRCEIMFKWEKLTKTALIVAPQAGSGKTFLLFTNSQHSLMICSSCLVRISFQFWKYTE